MFGPWTLDGAVSVSDLWIAAMGRALTASFFAFVLAGSVCLFWRRMPARQRGWLWWLVCAKSLLAFLLAFAVPVRVLPAPDPAVPSVYSGSLLVPAGRNSVHHASDGGIPRINSLLSHFVFWYAGGHTATSTQLPRASHSVHDATAANDQESVVLSAQKRADGPVSVVVVLFIVWMVCVLGHTLRIALGLALLRRAHRTCADCPDRIKAILLQSTDDLRLRCVPKVLISHSASDPFVAGLWRPTIYLPADMTATASDDELRMMLRHEVIHLRNCDLWLSALPTVSGILFFAFPHMWIVAREYVIAREEACDAGAATELGAYARLLVTAAARRPSPAIMALGSGYHALRRRLLSLTASGQTRTRAIWVARGLCGLGVAGLAPFTLAERPRHLATIIPTTPTHLKFTITDLGPLRGEDDGPASIDDRGEVALVVDGRAVVFGNGATAPLGGLPHYRRDSSVALSSSGNAVASCLNFARFPHGYIHGVTNTPLEGMVHYHYSIASAINDTGIVAGSVQNGLLDTQGAEMTQAVIWVTGKATPIGTLGGDNSRAYAIDNAGDVVGKADLPRNYFAATPHGYTRQTHAFLWSAGRLTDLETLGGENSLACAINDHKQVVGYSETASGAVHACLWEKGVPVDLPPLASGTRSAAAAVNDSGLVVGFTEVAPGSANHAAAWIAGRGLDLNKHLEDARGWTLTSAQAVNDRNQIVGTGLLKGARHAFLLTPA